MSKIQDAIALAKQWAADNSHGYDQTNRWGPDYDCSSFLISVWEAVGVPVKTNGATWTGNMKDVFCRCGFEVVTTDPGELSIGAFLQDGDILLNELNHAAMLVDGSKLVQASINEKGTANGGQTGDQTGREIYVRDWYSFPWDCALRYKETVQSTVSQVKQPTDENRYTVKSGDSWWGIASRELGDGGLMYQLAELNGKTVNDTIYPGQVLKLWDDGCESCVIDLSNTDPGDVLISLADIRMQVEKTVELLGGSVSWNY